MNPDRLDAAARDIGTSPLQYSHMLMDDTDMFIDEDLQQRIFNPLWLRMEPAPVENLTAYDAQAGITHPKFRVMLDREPRADTTAMVVRVRGVCKNNGRTPGSAAEAAIGVYFGPDSPYNLATRVPPSLPQAGGLAEILAVRMALQCVRDRWCNDHCILTVHVVTDSEYVVKALSEDIDEWRMNGFQNSQGEKVPNYLEIEKLDDLMLELGRDGVGVSFWPVDRRENEEADRLAKGALGPLSH